MQVSDTDAADADDDDVVDVVVDDDAESFHSGEVMFYI